MPTQVHKIIVSNRSALRAKYGTSFAGVLQPAIKALITADAARGLHTVVAYLDDSKAMKALGAAAVTSPANTKENKAAVDGIFRRYQPDYLLLLGSVDVIPHQNLTNPAFTANDPNGDPDRDVPSDLPYACPGAFSRNIRDFLNPTRVVGRLPDVTRGTDARVLARALATASGFTSRPPNTYRQYLGVTAAVWTRSTKLSLTGAFGGATSLHVVPPSTYRWTAKQLAKPSHFFNCHGDTAAAQYFGQPASGAASYPPALDARFIAGKIRSGTVVAAECCYGAELYDPALANGQHGIPNQYFMDGAYGFFGSTTIAYGPSTTNDWADVLCRDFFLGLLGGASLGRAVLQARQNYLAARAHLSSIDLKTLAQFYLLGDPAVQPVAVQALSPQVLVKKGAKLVASSQETASAIARAERRAMLTQNGLALAASVGIPGKSVEPPPQIKNLLRSRIERLGVKKMTFTSSTIIAPRQAGRLAKFAGPKAMLRLPRAIHLVIGRLATPPHVTCPALAGVELVQYDGALAEKQFRSR
ncbi:MAG TPA: hypothetical protein VNU68_31295 [Verrucomicrobiae bacterium]|nr:hypothetical protein [Verrucomicrobiae bacterium]